MMMRTLGFFETFSITFLHRWHSNPIMDQRSASIIIFFWANCIFVIVSVFYAFQNVIDLSIFIIIIHRFENKWFNFLGSFFLLNFSIKKHKSITGVVDTDKFFVQM